MSNDYRGPLIFSAKFIEPLEYADFDKKVLKKNFREVGKEVRAIARKNVSQKAVSKAGEFPGMQTGDLRRAISSRVSRSEFSVAIASYPKPGKDYYAPFVYYGHRAPGADRVNGVKDRRQQHKRRIGEKVAKPRKNYITEAAETYGQTKYQAVMAKVLVDAIKPGIIDL